MKNEQTVEYQIYQIKKVFQYYHGFLGLESYKSIVKQDVNINRYIMKYENKIKLTFDSEIEVLDVLYHMFNMNHPTDFKGHSMSVGDIIYMNDKFFYCDSYGWKEIQPSKEIPICTFDEYLMFEHNTTWSNNDHFDEYDKKYLQKDYEQFCYEQGYKIEEKN